MHRQIEAVKNLKRELTSTNCLVIANLNEVSACSSSNLKQNMELLASISKSDNLNFEVVNLSLLQIQVDGDTFKSNYTRIATFLNSILAV